MKVPVAAAKQAPVPGFGVLTLHAVKGRLQVLRPDGVVLDVEHTARRGVAGGYASLGATALVPTAQLGTGTANSGTFLRGDGIWAAGGGGGGTLDHAALTSNLAWTTSGHTGTASRIAGFDGGGAASVYTGAGVLDLVLTTRGDLPLRGAGTTARLPVGAANYLLLSDGTDPAWASPASVRTALDLATYYQPLTANLTALGSVTSAADTLPYFTGSGTAAVTTLTSFARTLLDDTTASAARTTLDAEQKVKLTDGAAVTRTVATLRDGEFLKVSGSSIISAAVNVAAFIALTDGFDQDPDENAFLTPVAIFMSDGSDA